MCLNTPCGRLPYNKLTQAINDALAGRVNDFTEAVDQVNQAVTEVATTSNLQVIARIFKVKVDEVAYIKTGLLLNSLLILFDELSETTWYVENAEGTVTTWNVSNNSLSVNTTTGSYQLNEANVVTSKNSQLNLDYGVL